jgi:riboflavin synthase
LPVQIFETTDLALAAFCKSRGLVLTDLKKNDRGIVTFIFEDEKNLSKSLMIAYLNSDERSFHESLKALKRLASSI